MQISCRLTSCGFSRTWPQIAVQNRPSHRLANLKIRDPNRASPGGIRRQQPQPSLGQRLFPGLWRFLVLPALLGSCLPLVFVPCKTQVKIQSPKSYINGLWRRGLWEVIQIR